MQKLINLFHKIPHKGATWVTQETISFWW